VVLILIDLDLKICLNGLQNKFKCEKKKEKKKTYLCRGWRPALCWPALPSPSSLGPSQTEPACSFPSLLLGQVNRATISPLFLASAWTGQECSCGRAFLFSESLTGETPLSIAPSSSCCGRARVRRCLQPNQLGILGFPNRTRYTRSINT
jgi:hypothetical protein